MELTETNLSAILPAHIARYLEIHGWILDTRRSFSPGSQNEVTYWYKCINGIGHRVFLPLWSGHSKYKALINDLHLTLSKTENRCPTEITKEMRGKIVG